MMKKSSVSRMQRVFVYSQILRYVLKKKRIRNQHQMLIGNDSWNGSKIDYNTEHWTQSSGISSQDSPHWSLSVKSKSSWAIWTSPNSSKDELSSCRCSMTSYGDIKTMKRSVLLIPHLRLFSQKDVQQDVGHSSGLSQKKSGITDKERPGGKCDRVTELMMINFGESGHPVFRATSPFSRGKLKSKRDGKFSTHLCRCRYDWNCFSRNDSCESVQYLRSSLIYVWRMQYLSNKNGETVLTGQSDPLFVPTSSLMKTPTLSTDDPAQEEDRTFDWNSCTRNLIAKVQKTSGKASTTIPIDEDLHWCKIPETVEVGQYFMTKHTDMSWAYFTTRRQTNWP